jgi:hypothetical protein
MRISDIPSFHTKLIVAAATACAGMALLLGCGGDSLGRHAISGTVSVNGAPLQNGNVSFQPVEKSSTTSGGAVVADGKYAVPRDKGLPTGKYRVVINAPKPGTGGEVAKGAAPGEAPPPPEELIPADWNANSEHTIEVTEKGPHEFKFEVSTKSK